ncbi:hypothetical protein M422DRAFT_27395 [Sphaerobolus stellatus SS14]|nr:hypothetical protein M422DRAFT_27395 [Sphaerobolus stellatus SS14]
MSTTKKGKDVSEHNYKINDIVLAKIRGYPAWPGQVVDPDKVPPAVQKERQSGKRIKFYCVRFFPAGDHSWVVAKDLSLLQKHEIEAYINEPHKKSGDLLQGYKIALNPSEWEAKMAQKLQEKAEEEADEDVDQLDDAEEGEEEDDEPKKKSRKRKRESEVKPKKKESTKSATGSEPKEKEKEKKAPPKKRTAKKNGVRSKEQIESEDDGAEAADGEEAADSNKKGGPPAKKAKKDKGGEDGELAHLNNNPEALKVKEWRHKLQRAFLSKVIPKPEDMPEHDQLMTTIEQHDLTIEQLQFSKLGKVMRHISQLDQAVYPIPNNDEFNIRKRAEALLEKWQTLIAASAPAETAAPASSVNGAKAEKPEKDVKMEDAAAASDAEEKHAVNGGSAEAATESKAEQLAKTEEPASDVKEEQPAEAAAPVEDSMDTSA